MVERRWTKWHNVENPHSETAVVDVEDGCVVVDYEVLSDMLVSLGFVEEVA